MKQCNSCKKLRKYLNEMGVCILCQFGPGGNPKEVKTTKSICVFET